MMYDIIIAGGGLAGLTVAIELARSNHKVLLIEKKEYPFHKVCGEYVSNEILAYLKYLGFDPFEYGASDIRKLRLSTTAGKNIYVPLDIGGFGLSRYTMDNALYELAKKSGAEVLIDRVVSIAFENDSFTVKTVSKELVAKLVIGSYGKRDTLDKRLNRPFISKHTSYLGVKYHVKTDYPADEIGLDNFKGGYCGMVKIEDDKYNLCYLYHKPRSSRTSVEEIEENVLYKNPVLKNIFRNSEFISDRPVAIHEISFASKSLVESHILMCGDAAGLITPLCGNGMSMAVSAAKILAELIIKSGICKKETIAIEQRENLERIYRNRWNAEFKKRLYWGRVIQRFFGSPQLTGSFIKTIHLIPSLEKKLLSYTHGKLIVP